MDLLSTQITAELVGALIAEQFPAWAALPVRPLPQSGWDNRTFRLGNRMTARLPSAKEYEAQVLREQQWLPYLRARLPIEVPEPLAMGEPGRGYPWVWSIYRWIEGDTAATKPVNDLAGFAVDLASFINALHAIPAEGGPMAGPQNFHRGGSLRVYDKQFRQAVAELEGRINKGAALAVWEGALRSNWNRSPVWVHGDLSRGNLLVREGRLVAAIDFGQLCVGDPACDLVIAWTYLKEPHRRLFHDELAIDASAWQRGRAWALWKAAILAAGLAQSNAVEGQEPLLIIEEVLNASTCTEA